MLEWCYQHIKLIWAVSGIVTVVIVITYNVRRRAWIYESWPLVAFNLALLFLSGLVGLAAALIVIISFHHSTHKASPRI